MSISSKYIDPLAPFEEKMTKEYGLRIAKFISGEWFNGGVDAKNNAYQNRREYVRKKRLFVRGESNNEYFKQQFSKGDNDLDYINLDWTQVNWAEKFARIVSNGLSDEGYKLSVRSVDALSQIKRRNKEELYRSYMVNKALIQKFKDTLGVDMTPQIEIPEDEEEMEIFMEMKDRDGIEIAEEILVGYVTSTNDWDVLEAQLNKDLVEVGWIVLEVSSDKNNGVVVRYVDPENYIHSPVSRNDFSDKYYDGYLEDVTIADIQRDSNLSEVDLRKIALRFSAKNSMPYSSNYSTCPIGDLLGHKITVLRFAYKTVKTIKYKTKKRNGKLIKASRKDDSFEINEGRDYGGLSKTLDTWVEGRYIVGTDYLYGYRECENIYSDVMNKAVSPFIAFAYDIYENRLRSFTDNIEAPARQLQKIHLKIQHLISELTPDLKEIDLDQLAELDDGKGGAKKEIWQTALEIMGVKGVVFKKRINMGDDGIKDQAAVRPFGTQQGSALTHLFNAWAHYYNLIRENTGVNPARDGTMSPDALVGVNQLAQLASNTVTRNIVDTKIMFELRLCEVISTRLHTIYNYKDGRLLQDLYTNVVSKYMLDAMEVMKDRHHHEFGFIFEMKPTTEEIREFNERLNMAIQEGTIDVEIVNEASNMAKSNIKTALRYLVYKRKKSIKQKQEEQMMMFKSKSENDAMAAQAKVEAEMLAYQEKKKTDLWFAQQMAEIEIMKNAAMSEAMLPEKDRQFREKAYLKQLEVEGMMEKERYREDRKDSRLDKQSSHQSKLVEQRKGNIPAIDFENQYEMGV